MIVSLIAALALALASASNANPSLQRLVEGNRRFMEDKLTCPERNSERRAAIAAKQDPFAIIVGCSDSRVPTEIIFDQGVGDLFIVRIAGNVIGKTELDSVNFSVTHHNPKVIMVLGHENCGAVKAVLDNDAEGAETVAALIQPSVDEARKKGGNQLETATKLNALKMVEFLKSTPLIKKQLEENKLIVIGGYYDLNSGEVKLL